MAVLYNNKEGSNVTPDKIMDALEAENIESRPIWKPMHLQPIFADCDFSATMKAKSVSVKIFLRVACVCQVTLKIQRQIWRK